MNWSSVVDVQGLISDLFNVGEIILLIVIIIFSFKRIQGLLEDSKRERLSNEYDELSKKYYGE